MESGTFRRYEQQTYRYGGAGPVRGPGGRPPYDGRSGPPWIDELRYDSAEFPLDRTGGALFVELFGEPRADPHRFCG
ncbi:hypothetical protein [Streptomyces sp. AJS327]|uniref:hypothetical protein n=1 Tax=Streptomyces sp. AJS327 TaxID=2545265 RepID=UPI001C60CBBB|nr:hypothetical protein [Streptomyces sp. AJS327]